MFVDPQVAAFVDQFAPPPAFIPGEENRQANVDAMRPWSRGQLPERKDPEFTGTRTEIAIPRRWGSLPARLYIPAAENRINGTIVWMHGGAMILGDLDKAEFAAMEIAETTGLSVVSTSYRLAPEHPYPAAAEDVIDCVKWIHESGSEHGLSSAFVALGGESAGGLLATTASSFAARDGVPRIDLQVLFYPPTDFVQRERYASRGANEVEGLDKEMMEFYTSCYTGPAGYQAGSLLSPMQVADEILAAAPPALIFTADADPLRHEAEAYAAKLASLGVEVTCIRAMGQTHGFVDFTTAAVSSRMAARGAYAMIRDYARPGRAPLSAGPAC